MRREFAAYFALFLVIAALGGIAWATRNPESAVLERAQDWPFVGSMVSRFRAAYLPEVPDAEDEKEWRVRGREPGVPTDGQVETIVVFPEAQPFVWLPRETAMYLEPAKEERELHRFQEPTRAVILDRRGDWYRVRRATLEGWVHLPGYSELSDPPFGSDPEPVFPLPARSPDSKTLGAARDLFAGPERSGRVGPYQFHTDVQDKDLLALCDQVAYQVEDLYRERTGLTPVGEPAEAVVLFAGEESYQHLVDRSEELAGLSAEGHMKGSVVATYAGNRPREAVASTLVHELTHLLNRRSLGPALPPWLDEGLAGEFAAGRIDPDGTIQPGTFGGRTLIAPGRVRQDGARGSVVNFRRRESSGDVLALKQLLDLGWQEFTGSGNSDTYYTHAMLFVRFLLADADSSGLRRGFKSYLASIARGKPATPTALIEHLGTSWPEVEVKFSEWVVALEIGPGVRATETG